MITIPRPAPTTVDIQVSWQGLTLGDELYGIDSLVGWLDLPGASFEGQEGAGHGVAVTPGVQGPRIVRAAGLIFGQGGGRDSLIANLRRAMVPPSPLDSTTGSLVVTAAGRTDTARAQPIGYTVTQDPKTWASGVVPWSASWRCPDPRIFGDPVSASALLLVNTAGAQLPRLLPFMLPGKPIGGRATIYNPGNDPQGSPAFITLTGAQSGTLGVRNATTGKTVTYAFGLATTDTLVIDTERGGAFLNGEYRPPAPWSDVTADLRAQPGMNIYEALGSAGAGSPSIAVVVDPASW